MANSADFIVENRFKAGDINVSRKLPDGTIDIDTPVAYGNEEEVHLPDPEVSLLIKAPAGVDTRNHLFKVGSEVDLAVSCSRTDSRWTINIVPNELPPTVPTTVNVNVGEDRPG